MSKQGVAQRVIDDMNRQRGRFETEIEHIAAVRVGGMQMLLDELSAEARRVLLENEDALEQARSSKDAVEHHRLVIRRLTLISTFLRLGLDLESEEER